MTCREAIAAQRQRMVRLDKQYHCVVQMLPDDETSDGDGAGELAGIALAHKDIFSTRNRQAGAGHNQGSSAPGLVPATAIARLRGRGANNLAALALAEYACGATGENANFERCVNPLLPQAAVGGSSSGSAVAVASNMAYASLGTDTAGSVRIPAATCALLGLKTTHRLIPLEGVYPLAPSLDSVGLLTRSAADAMQVLGAVADVGLLKAATTQPLRTKAWLPEAGLHPDIAAALESFAQECGVTGWIRQWDDQANLTHLAEIVMHVEAAGTHRTALLEGMASPAVEAVALAGLVIPQDWYRAALADRARRTQAFVDAHLHAHDLLLLPALPQPVPDWRSVSAASADFDIKQLLALHRYMGFVNYLGCPSVVIPIARDARGLPISVQIIARPFHEPDLLAFAFEVESRRFGKHGFTEHFCR